jgi:hypothetical protein
MNAMGASFTASAAEVHPTPRARDAATAHFLILVVISAQNFPLAFRLRYSPSAQASDEFNQHLLEGDAVQRVSGLGSAHCRKSGLASCCRRPEYRYAAARPPLMVDAHDVIGFKFVRHRAVSRAGDHGGHSGALLHEVFLADRVIETLTNGNIAKFGAVTGRVIGHTKSQYKWMVLTPI